GGRVRVGPYASAALLFQSESILASRVRAGGIRPTRRRLAGKHARPDAGVQRARGGTLYHRRRVRHRGGLFPAPRSLLPRLLATGGGEDRAADRAVRGDLHGGPRSDLSSRLRAAHRRRLPVVLAVRPRQSVPAWTGLATVGIWGAVGVLGGSIRARSGAMGRTLGGTRRGHPRHLPAAGG